MARVLDVIAASTASASMSPVRGSMSAKTTLAPACSAALPVDRKLRGVVTTSSPGPTPSARRASTRPIEQLDTPTAWAAPTWCAKASSNSAARGPALMNTSPRVRSRERSSSLPSGWL